MRSYLLAVIVFFSLSVSAQNIVSNPDFALHINCPDDASQMIYCDNWNSITMATPDYFHTCATVGSIVFVGVPSNDLGYQESASGSYAGAVSFEASGSDYREYITTSIPALSVGTKYRVTLKVSLANFSEYASAGLGVFFYIHNKPDSVLPVGFVIPAVPQIDYSSFGIIADTTNWVVLSKEFIADSAYTHLVIGNYYADSTIDTISVSGGSLPYAYYYYDSFAVEEVIPAITVTVSSQKLVTVYPNPFARSCKLLFDNSGHLSYDLIIFNMQGAQVRELKDITTSEVTINRDNLQNGIYFYELRGSDNSVSRGKIIVD